jgi:hypothetical protein
MCTFLVSLSENLKLYQLSGSKGSIPLLAAKSSSCWRMILLVHFSASDHLILAREWERGERVGEEREVEVDYL